MEEQQYWVEIAPTAKHGVPPMLIPMEEAGAYTGFMSNYAYGITTKEWIENNYSVKYNTKGSMVGLVASRLPVYTDRLFVDFDENPLEDARKLCKDLRTLGIQYSVWESGGRSYHVHIYCDPKENWRIPASQCHWISSWAQARGAIVDLSIYQAAGLFRMPGTIHAKAGRPKKLIDFHKGGVLDYDLIEVGETQRKPPANREEAERVVWRLLLTGLGSGGRQFHIYKIATQAWELGWNEAKIIKHCLWWNDHFANPKLTKEQVEEKVWESIR